MAKPPPLLVQVQDEPQRGDASCGKIILTYRDQRMAAQTEPTADGFPRQFRMPETFDRRVTVPYAGPAERDRLLGKYMNEMRA